MWATYAFFIALFVCYLVAQRSYKGLSKYPGPYLASLTNVWRAVDVSMRDTHITYRKLHAKYGDVVRVGPNVLSFGNPSAIQDIYGLNKGFIKVSSDGTSRRAQRD
jgi:hypothetical protein